jgi:transposase
MPGDRTFHVIEAVIEPGGDVRGSLLRRWPDEFKERAVAATLVPGVNVSVVARQMGISPAQLFGWPRPALAKGMASPRTDGDVPIDIASPHAVPVVEITIGNAVIRVDADIGEAVLHAVRQS